MNRQTTIRELKSAARSKETMRHQRAIRTATKLIEQLDDENRSLWNLLDEMKQSEIINHGDVLREEIQDVIDRTKVLLMTKVEEA